MKTYYLLADTKKGLIEMERMIHTDLEAARREAIRISKEMGVPVVVVSPVFDTRDILEIDSPHTHEWERNARGEMVCIHCGMYGPTGETTYPTREK